MNTESGNAVNKLYLKISHFTSKRKIGNLPCNIRYRGHKQLIIANNTGAFVFHLVFFSMSRQYNIIYKYHTVAFLDYCTFSPTMNNLP